MAYYNVPILSNYLNMQGIVVKLKDSNFTQGQEARSIGYRSLHSLASCLRRLSSLLTVFCTQIIRTSMHECKKINTKNLQVEVRSHRTNLPKWPKICLLCGKCDQPAESGQCKPWRRHSEHRTGIVE